MNVRAPKQMIVMLTPCAPTLKVLICVAVLESLKETGKLVQVGFLFFCMIVISISLNEKKSRASNGGNGIFFLPLLFSCFLLLYSKTSKQEKQLVNMLWFNFILEINFICPFSWVWWGMITSLKQKQIKFKPRTKLNCSKYTSIMVSANNSTNYSSSVNEKNYRGWLFGNYLHQPVVYFPLKNVKNLCKLESLLVIRF